MPSRNCFDLLVKIVVVLAHVIASARLNFVEDVIVLEFFGVKLRMVMYLIMRGTPWRTIFDKVNDGSILRQGGSLATNDSPRGTALRTSPTPPLSRSDLVPWHFPAANCDTPSG